MILEIKQGNEIVSKRVKVGYGVTGFQVVSVTLEAEDFRRLYSDVERVHLEHYLIHVIAPRIVDRPADLITLVSAN